MKTKDISFPRYLLRTAPQPGRQNPIPSTPEQEPDEPQRTPGPKRKKKSIYEIVM